MNPWLYLNATGLHEPSLDWPCYLPASGQWQPLRDAAQALDGHAVNLLLPMEACSWLRSEPWPGKRRPAVQAVAFAVEEQLGESLETLHLSVGARDSEGCYPVLVVGRERFAHVLALLAEAGVEVRGVYVDADLLPTDQAWGVRWAGRWLLGGALPARLALTDEALALLRPSLPATLQWRDDGDLAPWPFQGAATAINLRHGEFAPRRRPLPWRLGAATLLGLALLAWAAAEVRLSFLHSETRQLQARNEARFKALYPQQSRIVDLAAQLQAQQNRGAQPQGGRMAELVRLTEQVIGASTVQVRRIELRPGEGWKIQLDASSFAELEQLRERGREQGQALRLDSASKDGDRVQATLVVEAGA